ncbi:MAG: ATP-binding protein [Rivularia sp. T60_A2020_040]|nr:ATP-binding protein [Rivularia sp. T60_A2020_040]
MGWGRNLSLERVSRNLSAPRWWQRSRTLATALDAAAYVEEAQGILGEVGEQDASTTNYQCQAGKIKLNLQPVELREVIETAIATVRLSLEAKNIQLECMLAALPIIVHGDRDRLQQIILNLLTNAIKFTEAQGRIEVRLDASETQAEISVSDNGCGISAEFLPNVFDTFRQESGLKGGLGMGMAIAHNLVELHGGTIHVQSPGIGQGAMFRVMLPLII